MRVVTPLRTISIHERTLLLRVSSAVRASPAARSTELSVPAVCLLGCRYGCLRTWAETFNSTFGVRGLPLADGASARSAYVFAPLPQVAFSRADLPRW